MRKLLVVIMLFLAEQALGGPTVRPTLDLSEVSVRVHWMDSEHEIAKLARRYERRSGPLSLARAEGVAGFAILRRNVETGTYSCDVYVMRPKRVNDRETTALGHELLHCLLGDYHP